MPTSNLFLIVCSFFIAKIHITISERSNPNVNLFKKKSRSFLRKLLYRFSDQLVVQTPYVKEYFEAYVKADKIKIIKNPIEIINTKSFDKKNVILTVGTLNKNKNQALILKSFSQLNAPDWELHICGDGGEIDNLKRLAVDLNVENKVKFFGVVSNVEDYFSYASVFAFSSLSEGFPNVILEAMNNNCACISTDCPTGPSELIEHKKNGFLIALNETSAYTSYLQKLVDSENLRNQFCVESKIRIQKCSLPNIAKQWIS
jgi:GalNAc-alpha-(1->4)-GalNAc-alpha-(1->3)-diNAcBac-PP-undecaprenol alpha-1,4-N-acetyl-D-galactosaminyltransferase